MKVRPSALIIQNNHALLMHYRYGDVDVYALPGGNPDRGETLPQVTERELEEELGITVEVGPMILAGEVIRPESDPTQAHKVVLHVVFAADIIAGFPVLNPEHTTALAIVWKPVRELDSLNMYPNVGQYIQDLILKQSPLGYVGTIDQAFF
nr:NUDIX domain-containing protein [uncultured Arsenicibacter sp.]